MIIGAAALSVLAACASPEERAAAYVAKAQALYDQGDYIQAGVEARNAAQIQPKNAQARYLLALVAEQKEDFKAAFGHLSVAVDADPANVEARLKLATLFAVAGVWPDVLYHSKELLKQAPNDPRVLLLQARFDLQYGNLVAARAGLEKALQLDPDYIDAILVSGAFEATQDLDQGLAIYDAAIKRLPAGETRGLREQRIQMLVDGKRIDEVEAGLVALSRDFPKDGKYQRQLAMIYVGQGRMDDADRVYRELIEIDPVDVTRRVDYAKFLVGQQQAPKAEAFLKKSIDERPDADGIRLKLGNLYEASGRLDDAKAAYAALAVRSPKTVDGIEARIRIAVIEATQKNDAAAKKAIDEILVDVPDEPTALLMRAGIRLKDGKTDDAIADLRLVLRKQPESAAALLLLAQSHAGKNETAVAKDVYRQLLKVEPDSEAALRGLIGLHVANLEFADAEQFLRDRLNAQPDDMLASRFLVDLLLRQGQKDKAEAEAKRVAGLPGQGGLGDISIGQVLAAQQDYSGAADAFRKSMVAGGGLGDPLAIEGLVRSLNAAGKRQEAIDILKQLEVEGGKDGRAFSNLLLADIHAESGDRAAAERALEVSISAKPEVTVGYLALARLHANDPAAQTQVFRRALKALPGNVEIGLLLGGSLETQGQYEESISSLEALYTVNPGNLSVMNNLASALLDHRTDRASYQRALELAKKLESSEDSALLDTLGWAYYRAGEFAQAVSVLERVIAKEDRVAVYHYHLGMAYLAMNNKVGAQQQLEQAVAGDAQYVGLDQARKALTTLAKPVPEKTAAVGR
jgi:tetratricopeptide (TPR) repeat protein